MDVQYCGTVVSEDGILLFGDARSLQYWRVSEVGDKMVQEVDFELSNEICGANIQLETGAIVYWFLQSAGVVITFSNQDTDYLLFTLTWENDGANIDRTQAFLDDPVDLGKEFASFQVNSGCLAAFWDWDDGSYILENDKGEFSLNLDEEFSDSSGILLPIKNGNYSCFQDRIENESGFSIRCHIIRNTDSSMFQVGLAPSVRNESMVMERVINFPEFSRVPHFQYASKRQHENYRVNPSDGAEMRLIPSGTFTMGYHNGQEDEKPEHEATLTKDYWMYRTPVTVAQYLRFCKETGKPEPAEPKWGWQNYEQHPIVNVNWHDAVSYCEWAGGQLPTEAQWERAARGGQNTLYPWGDEWDNTKCQSSKRRMEDSRSTSPVGLYGAFGYGLCDMTGNVYEYCADWYDEDFYRRGACVDPVNLKPARFRSLRGGAWSSTSPALFRVSYRSWGLQNICVDVCGFRCCVIAR